MATNWSRSPLLVNMRIALIISFNFLFSLACLAQVSRTLPASDTTQVLDKETRKRLKQQEKALKKIRREQNWALPYPNPYKAGLYSLIIPGGGQIYNKRYWKAPLVWGAVGGMIYLIDNNKTQKDRFEKAYGLRVSGIEDDEFVGIIGSADGIKRYRDQYDKWLQQSYLGLVGIYMLNALEAYVDAHLKNFDISEDLSFHLQPYLGEALLGNSIGLTLRFQLGK